MPYHAAFAVGTAVCATALVVGCALAARAQSCRAAAATESDVLLVYGAFCAGVFLAERGS
jgi:hypothetical protein